MADPLRYEIRLPERLQHLVRVTLQVPADLGAGARLVMPTWTAGSYVMRDYVHHVQWLTTRRSDGTEVEVTRDGHTAWRLPDGLDGVVVEYELYANDLTVRTNHVDDHHALLVPPATFVFVEGAEDRPVEVAVDAGGDPVWSLLPAGEVTGTFVARDVHHLMDAAFEVGDHPHVDFEVHGVPHRFVWAGHGGRPDLGQVAEDGRAIAAAAVDLFHGDLPIDAYTFLTVGWDAGGGGLEHRDGAVLMMPVTTFQEPDTTARFQSLIAHEYLHLWNVKRMTPAELVAPDLTRHTHTRLLWVAEGWTAYYDELLALRAGCWTVDRYLRTLGESVDRVLERPGTAHQSVEESSYEAWVKQYVRDENWDNAGTDYYGHGALLAWCLDLHIRAARPDSDGLDEAFRTLWQRFGHGTEGYTDADVRAAVADAAGLDLGWFFDAHVRGRALPDVEALVGAVGLEVHRPEPEEGDVPDLGVRTTDDDRGVTFASVERGGPAWSAGVTGGDRLVGIDGEPVARAGLTRHLRRHDAGDTIHVTVVRGPRLLTLAVTLGEPRRPRRLRRTDDPSPEQVEAFRRWTGGHDLPTR